MHLLWLIQACTIFTAPCTMSFSKHLHSVLSSLLHSFFQSPSHHSLHDGLRFASFHITFLSLFFFISVSQFNLTPSPAFFPSVPFVFFSSLICKSLLVFFSFVSACFLGLSSYHFVFQSILTPSPAFFLFVFFLFFPTHKYSLLTII